MGIKSLGDWPGVFQKETRIELVVSGDGSTNFPLVVPDTLFRVFVVCYCWGLIQPKGIHFIHFPFLLTKLILQAFIHIINYICLCIHF